MKSLPRLGVVLILCLISTVMSAVPAQAACPPYTIELSPKSGSPGTNASISGYRFAASKLVDIYYDGSRIASSWTDRNGDFTINFTIPEGCKGLHEVKADVGYVTVHTYFSVKPALTVSPAKGPRGTNVTVMGRGFASNEEGIELVYYITDNYRTVQKNIKANAQGSWQTSFQIPSSTRGGHKIDAWGAVSKDYEVKEAVFRVTAEISTDASSGIPEDTITVTGNRFGAYEKDIKILFGGETLVTGIKASFDGEWSARFTVPHMPAGVYSVTAEGSQTNREDIIALSFEIKPEIALSSAEGNVGMNLTVVGRGFAANQEVTVAYDGSQVASAMTSDEGSFEAVFSVPESKHGEHRVTVGYAGTNHAASLFAVESVPPPVPTLLSPAMGSRVGFTSQATPTLEWSPVSDDSGVRYSLQIATSEDFAPSSVIASLTGLTEASYTPTGALPSGTYYWRVQAVDRAENESSWTAPRSFRVGTLPKWGLVVAIALSGVALLVFLTRALVRRRAIYYDRW